MERRYTALAQDQGKLAAEKEKLLAENAELVQVTQGDEPYVSDIAFFQVAIVYAHWLVFPQDLQAAKTENNKLKAVVFEKDAITQRKDAEVRSA